MAGEVRKVQSFGKPTDIVFVAQFNASEIVKIIAGCISSQSLHRTAEFETLLVVNQAECGCHRTRLGRVKQVELVALDCKPTEISSQLQFLKDLVDQTD